MYYHYIKLLMRLFSFRKRVCCQKAIGPFSMYEPVDLQSFEVCAYLPHILVM